MGISPAPSINDKPRYPSGALVRSQLTPSRNGDNVRSEDNLVAKPPSQLTLTIDPGPGADDEDRAALAQRLREELQEVGGAEIHEVIGAADTSRRTKGVDMAWGTLAVTVAPGVITALVSTLQSWLTRHERSKVTVKSGDDELVVEGSPSQEQRRLIEAWVGRHKV